MEAQHYRKLWWQIILATLSFSIFPLLILGGGDLSPVQRLLYRQDMDNMKTLAENRGQFH